MIIINRICNTQSISIPHRTYAAWLGCYIFLQEESFGGRALFIILKEECMKRNLEETQYHIMNMLKYLAENYGSEELGRNRSSLCRVYLLSSLMLDSHMTFNAIHAMYQALDVSGKAEYHLRIKIAMMQEGAREGDRNYKPLIGTFEKEYLGRYSTYSITIEGLRYLCDMMADIPSWADGEAGKRLAEGKAGFIVIPTREEYRELYDGIKAKGKVGGHRILTSQCMAQIQGYGRDAFLLSKEKGFSYTGEMLEGTKALRGIGFMSPDITFDYMMGNKKYPVMIEADTGSERVSAAANQELKQTVLDRKTVNHLELSETREGRVHKLMPETLIYILGRRETDDMPKRDDRVEALKVISMNKNLIQHVTTILRRDIVKSGSLGEKTEYIDTQDIISYIDEEIGPDGPDYESIRLYRELMVKLTDMYAPWCDKIKRRSLLCSDIDRILRDVDLERKGVNIERGNDVNRSDAKVRLSQLANAITLPGAGGREVETDFYAGVTVSLIPACDVQKGLSTLLPFHFGFEDLKTAAKCYGFGDDFGIESLMPYFHMGGDRWSYAMKNCCFEPGGRRLYIEDLGLDIGAFYRLGRYLSCTPCVLKDCMALFIVNDDLTAANGNRVDSEEFWAGIETFAKGFRDAFLYAYRACEKLPILKQTHDFAFIRRSDYIRVGKYGVTNKTFISFPGFTIGRIIGAPYGGELMHYREDMYKWFSERLIEPTRVYMPWNEPARPDRTA